MKAPFEIRGIGVVNATPLTADDRLDEAEYRRHVRWMLDAGVRFIQPAATAGQELQPVPAAIEHMLNRMGWAFGAPRMPVRPLSPAAAARVDAVCGRLGLY